MQFPSRGNWSGILGFVLASMGSAVGLGNLWRYPYVTGQYGGAAFILLYIACVLAVGVPLLLAEFLIGRKTQRNPLGAFRTLRPGSPWVFTGWLGVFAGFVILSYYGRRGGLGLTLCLPFVTKTEAEPFKNLSLERSDIHRSRFATRFHRKSDPGKLHQEVRPRPRFCRKKCNPGETPISARFLPCSVEKEKSP